MDRPQGAISSHEVLVEALENVDKRNIKRVVVLAFNEKGYPVGWLSNVGSLVERVGLIELGKQVMILEAD